MIDEEKAFGYALTEEMSAGPSPLEGTFGQIIQNAQAQVERWLERCVAAGIDLHSVQLQQEMEEIKPGVYKLTSRLVPRRH